MMTKKPVTRTRTSVAATVLDALHDEFGEESATTSGAHRESQVSDWISTQCFALDLAIGRAGIPCGRLTVIQGKEASGKTTVVTHIMAECQRRGGLAVYLDAEYAYDSERAAKMGLYDADTMPKGSTLEPLVIINPEHVENALSEIEAVIHKVRKGHKNLLTVIVWDSVAGTPTASEVKGSFEDMQPGVHARRLSAGLRKITKLVATDRIALIFVNQLKEMIGGFGFGGPQMTTIAARPLGFHATVRIETAQIGVVGKDRRSSTGIICKAKITKNKVAPPFREAEFPILYNTGIDDAEGRIGLAISAGIIKKVKGNRLDFDGVVFRPRDITDEQRAKINERLEDYRAGGNNEALAYDDDEEEEED
jgi:recombination protein RecA